MPFSTPDCLNGCQPIDSDPVDYTRLHYCSDLDFQEYASNIWSHTPWLPFVVATSFANGKPNNRPAGDIAVIDNVNKW